MFKDRSIEGKFIVSIVLISLITLIFGYFTLSWYVQQNKVKAYGQIQKNITTKINHQFNTKKLIGLTNAVSIVNDIRIKEALKTDNRELAITSLRDLEKKIKDISPYKNIKIHLHTKDIKSFVRFWRLDKFGDDLSGFRDSLVKVKKTRKELTTFDIGKAGLTYRSIIPILDKDDNYLGSLEIIQGLTSIAKQLDKVDSGFVLLMDKKKVEVSQFNEDKLFQKNYLISQNFVNDIFIKDAQNIDLKSIFKDKYFLTKKFFYTHIDIKDYKNKKLGIVLVGTPTNRLNTMLSASNEIIYMALLITISLGIFIISVMGFILKRFVLNPLHLLEKGLKSFFDYLEDSKKEIHEIPITSNDEFGKMNENINKSINISVHMYKELEDLTQNLEVKIDERTKELKKERKKALDATNAKSDFLAKMSHEIRTPMNAVLGMLYLTQKTNLNLMQDNYISKASSAAKSLLAIINDILDFSKIEAGKLSLENKDILFNDMIHETMDIMSFNAQEKGCELLAYYDNNIPAVIKSDKLRIQQILNNLISNAIKFTTHGEVVISSKLIKHQNNIATIKFCVKDSGIGINQEGQSKLFQDFSQVDDTITRKFGGTGLGLAISKKLSDMLGGEIWLEESTLNIGSIFCFTITAEISSHTIQKPSFFPMEMNDINTLIIDDNRIACDVLKDMLESFGFNVDVANNGQDGYDTIVNSDKNYDLLFLDYQMPKLNGIQTYKKIKTIQNKPIPKTIMITAYSENVVINEIKMLGIKSYLTKPVSPSTLYDTIIEVLNPHKEKNKILIDKNEFDTLSIEGIKILLVEDNELNQDFAVALLESADISVDIANDGVEALKLVKSKIYDTVLMDIQMPNMDGLTATKLIRDMQKDDIYFKDLPIIALSANTLAEDIEKSLNAGMNRHISKPINPEELFEALEQFAGHKYIEKPILNTQTNNQDDILNTDEALSRIGGNEMVYDKLLEKFIKKYKNVDKEIFKYIENKDLSTAQKKSHEVKGVAGNIGAIDLFNSLTLIDKLLKKGEVPTKEHFDKIAKSVNDTVDTITKYIQKEKSNQKELGKELDSIRAKKILTFIKNNVENDIMECENKIEELIPLFVDTKYLDKFELLREYFDEFDLDSAIDIVDQLLNDI